MVSLIHISFSFAGVAFPVHQWCLFKTSSEGIGVYGEEVVSVGTHSHVGLEGLTELRLRTFL